MGSTEFSDDAVVPLSADEAERRRHLRVPVALVVKLKFSSVGQFLESHASDISRGGMFIRGEQASVGQTLIVQFDAGSERLVEGTARVVRLVPEAGIGVEFIDMDELSAELIAAVVERTLLLPG